MDYNLPDSLVHGILQAIILEWVAISFSRGSSQLRDWTQVSHTAGRFFIFWATREAHIGIFCPIDKSPIKYICLESSTNSNIKLKSRTPECVLRKTSFSTPVPWHHCHTSRLSAIQADWTQLLAIPITSLTQGSVQKARGRKVNMLKLFGSETTALKQFGSATVAFKT